MNEVVPTDPRLVFRKRLEDRKTEIRNSLPSDISADTVIRAYVTSTQLNPELLTCTWQSLWDALIKACRAGLLPDGVESAIVPYKSKATFIPMVQGVLRSARRSGNLKWIDANVVREGEVFEYKITQDGPRFLHEPGDDFKAPILRVYAVATTLDGGFFCAVMSAAEIAKHRAFSRASRDDSPWNQWPEAMSIKTAIKQLGKWLPSVRDAISGDDTIVDPPPSERGSLKSPHDITPAPRPETPVPGLPEEGAQADVETTAVGDPPAASLETAYIRGEKAKQEGLHKRAIPGEYRDAARTREALAWQAGYDGLAMPNFATEEEH